MDFSTNPQRPDSCYRVDARVNASFLNEGAQPLGPSHHHHHSTNSTSKNMQSYSPTITDDLYSLDQLSLFSPLAPALDYFPTAHHQPQQPQQQHQQMQHQRQHSLQQHQHQLQAQQPAQASLMLPSVPSISSLGQQQQQQQQQYHQASLHYQPHTSTYDLPQSYEFVQRQAPSSRAYAYHPYASSPTMADSRLSGYTASAWDMQTQALQQQQLHAGMGMGMGVGVVDFQDYNQYPSHAHNGTVHPAQLLGCADPHSFSPQSAYDNNNAQPQFHCIAPEELFSPQPLTPISPYQSSKDEDSSDRSSSPGTSSGSSGRNSPTSTHRLAINTNVPTAVERQREAVSAATNAGWAHAGGSGSASPVDSLSSPDSADDRETTFIPPASVKKAVLPSKAKRATRSAPEPAWVEAVLAEDAKRLQDGLSGSVSGGKPANRPIAFACVFCRHRKIQCIRPKTETAPGEKPAPCNQCEKRNRCCEYPPAALNPRIGRRTTKERSSISKGDD